MKRIAIFIPTMRAGGAEKQAAILASLLSRQFDVTLIVFHGELGINTGNMEYLKDTSVRRMLLAGSYFHKLKLLYREFENTDILFNYLTFCDFVGGLLARCRKVEQIYSGIRCQKMSAWKILLEKIGAKAATKVIFNSHNGRDSLGDRISDKSKQVVIPNCLFSESKFNSRPDKDKKTIVTIARFVPEKDFETALRSIKELSLKRNDFSYVIVGYGPLEGHIRQIISEENLDSTVKIVIRPNRVSDYFENADIYLSTSTFEGISNSIMEAMDAGLPIVTTNAGDAKYMVSEKNGFLTNPGDWKSIVAGLSALLDSCESRNEKGRNSFLLVRELFSSSAFLENYIKLINS